MTDVVSVDSLEPYPWGEGCRGWRLVDASALSVIQESVPPGRGEKRHHHVNAGQFFFVLDGQATLEVDGELLTLGVRQGLFVPAGTPHQLRNETGQDLVFLVISSPRSHGDRIDG